MIVVTTPTGNIGHQVAERLLDAGLPVRVVARDPSRLLPRIAREADVVQGSHGDPAVVERAFPGADAVFWLPPSTPAAPNLAAIYDAFVEPACAVFRSGSVGRVVGVSALGRGVPQEAGHVTASLRMDDAIAATGVPYRALANPSFMENLVRQAGSIRTEGVFRATMAPARKDPACATRDIAATAVRLLRDTSWTGHGHVAVLGPEDLSANDMARIMSEVLGKPVRYQQVPLDAFKAAMLGRGASEPIAQGYYEMMRAKENGLDHAEPRTAENTTPTGFRQWCEEVLKPAVLA